MEEKKSVHVGVVNFILRGQFDPDEVTEFLGIVPTGGRRKGASNPDLPHPKFSSWSFGSGYIESELYDLYEVSKTLVARLAPKAGLIREIRERLGLEAILSVGLWISMDERISTPALGCDVEVIRFLAEVGASLDIDSYRLEVPGEAGSC